MKLHCKGLKKLGVSKAKERSYKGSKNKTRGRTMATLDEVTAVIKSRSLSWAREKKRAKKTRWRR